MGWRKAAANTIGVALLSASISLSQASAQTQQRTLLPAMPETLSPSRTCPTTLAIDGCEAELRMLYTSVAKGESPSSADSVAVEFVVNDTRCRPDLSGVYRIVARPLKGLKGFGASLFGSVDENVRNQKRMLEDFFDDHATQPVGTVRYESCKQLYDAFNAHDEKHWVVYRRENGALRAVDSRRLASGY